MTGIYLDNNATTAVDPRVVEAMVDALGRFGNPASLHAFGEEAASLVEAARIAVTRLLGARSPDEVVFTSGGTESIHTALTAALAPHAEGVIVTGATEHAAVARALERWAERGFSLEIAPVDGAGRLDLEHLLALVAGPRPVRLVSVHAANNETGVRLTDDELEGLAGACRNRGVPLHLDAVQMPGKLPLRVHELGVDLLSISAHKFHGPKGIGALYVRSGGPAVTPLLVGGPQEDGRRAGTSNVPGIVGLGRAAELAREHEADPAATGRVRELRDRLESGLLERVPGAAVNGAGAPRLDNTSNLRFPDLDGELLLPTLFAEGLAVSGGAACSSREQAPSRVLLAMGLPDSLARASVRFSLSRLTTEEEVERALELVPPVVAELRALEGVGGTAPG